MGTELAPVSGALAGLVAGPGPEGGLALPFARRILILVTAVAGTSYAHPRRIEPGLHVGDTLTLLREPRNRHDGLAVLVLDTQKRKVGYVPRDANEVIARLMDAGKRVTAELTFKEWHGDYLSVGMKLYLEDL